MQEEWLDIVNDNDEVIGRDLKSNKTVKRFLSRNVVVHLQTTAGKFVLVQRAAHKKIEPLKYDLGACGNVMAGETYEQAAQRELLEEVGVETILTLLNKRKTVIPIDEGLPLEFLTGIFHGVHDGPFTFNEESAGVKMMTLEEIEKTIQEQPGILCKPFIEDFELTKTQLKELQKRFKLDC
ncbi:NUDIX domain-containing protein [Candidatus Woesearchaeota archaeon]|nr:NUDIX domain-containing protein [Candidatus Woesearchaeota archaeon]